MSEQRFRTIVADPPWPMPDSGIRSRWARSRSNGTPSIVPYERMTLQDIWGLPVGGLAETDAHLYLWTTNGFLLDGYRAVEAWGFRPSTLLTWCKAPRGLGFGGAYSITTEFVIFARRGTLAPRRRWDSTWFQFKRPYDSKGAVHSGKPEGFLDVVEQVSPGPYLEMFARRARLGWDYYGDESLGTVSLPSQKDAA